ncbi:hypothetical protein BCD49_35780 [Pseudofrankia sp. EUN1h]|nr:hypothetical protein BCD49_35780 [Pseudofrankia sp. EUN1h]
MPGQSRRPAPPPSTATATAGDEFMLAPGGSWRAPDGGLTVVFVGVTQDSRCPASERLQCFWAGDATVALSATVPGQAATAIELHTHELHTHPNLATSGTVANHPISLIRLEPENSLDGPDPGDYRAYIRVG